MSDKTSNKELQKVTRRLLHIDKRINSGKSVITIYLCTSNTKPCKYIKPTLLDLRGERNSNTKQLETSVFYCY